MDSPTKRRALAPLNANALSSPKPNVKAIISEASPLRKRAVEASAAMASPRPEKRNCVEQQTKTEDETSRSRSRTPDEDDSSLFDGGDASWASNTTPDASPAPRVLTREQAREKAEILRLRLGLASYKVRTGQTSVPLADLVVKPLPSTRGSARSLYTHNRQTSLPRNNMPASSLAETRLGNDGDRSSQETESQASEGNKEASSEEDTEEAHVHEVSRAETKLSNGASTGGAVSGLLSLARGNAE